MRTQPIELTEKGARGSAERERCDCPRGLRRQSLGSLLFALCKNISETQSNTVKKKVILLDWQRQRKKTSSTTLVNGFSRYALIDGSQPEKGYPFELAFGKAKGLRKMQGL